MIWNGRRMAGDIQIKMFSLARLFVFALLYAIMKEISKHRKYKQ